MAIILNLKQVLFRMFLSRVENWASLGISIRMNLFQEFHFRNFRRLIKYLHKTFCKLKYLIISFHVDICEHNFGFINDAVFLCLDLVYHVFSLDNDVILFFGLVDK